jgi:hypothetical protein
MPPLIETSPGVLEFALDRVGDDAVEILELSYNDIPWSWICGTLTRACVLNGHKKPEGCALGLIGMNGGLASFSTRVVRLWDNEIGKDVPTGQYEVQGIFEQSDLYATSTTAEAIVCLALAIPKEITVSKAGWYNEVDEAYDKWADNIPHDVSGAADCVVAYNDDDITRGDAASWFCNAIGIARLRRSAGKQASTWMQDEDGCEDPSCQQCYPTNSDTEDALVEMYEGDA